MAAMRPPGCLFGPLAVVFHLPMLRLIVVFRFCLSKHFNDLVKTRERSNYHRHKDSRHGRQRPDIGGLGARNVWRSFQKGAPKRKRKHQGLPGLPYFRTDEEYWTWGPHVFFGTNENTNLGMHLSSMLGLLIDELYSNPILFSSADTLIAPPKRIKMKEEAVTQFTITVGQHRSGKPLFSRTVLNNTPFPTDMNALGSVTYYRGKMSPPRKGLNGSYEPLWVSAWLIKTSLVRVSTFNTLHSFLRAPSAESILDVKWIHDSIIVPVEIIVHHFFDSGRVWNKQDRRRHKLQNFFKAVFLEIYLLTLSSMSLPLPFLDKDLEPNDPSAMNNRQSILNAPENADINTLIQQQEQAKRHYPGRHLSALCVLCALHLCKTEPAFLLEPLIKMLGKTSGTLKDSTASEWSFFIDNILLLSFASHPTKSLDAFIKSKTRTDGGPVPAVFDVAAASPNDGSVPVVVGVATIPPAKKRARDDDASSSYETVTDDKTWTV